MIKNSLENNENIDFSNLLVLIPTIIMLASIVIPCIVWFIRNLFRIVLHRDTEWLTQNLKWFFITGLVVFVVCLFILILSLTGVIK